MDVLKDLIALIGCKIKFETYDGEYEGIVKGVSLETRKVNIESVFKLPWNEYKGDLQFFFSEFWAYSKCNEKTDVSQVCKERNYSNPTKSSSRNKPCKNISQKELKTEFVSKQLESDKDRNFDDFFVKLPPKYQDVLPMDSVILDSIDREFKLAADHISRQNVIGVSFKGCKISRNGKFIWICIATNCCVFFFDIQTLGSDAFDNGLRTVFQNQNIVKVIHDCRYPSGCLFHLYSTSLVNVFDTQVADFLVNKNRFLDAPSTKNMNSLDTCLVNYLEIPNEFLYNDKMLLSCAETDNYFEKRPLYIQCRNILIKNTLYLILLREKLKKLMLNSVYKASNAYLRTATSDPSTVPSELLSELQILSFQDNSIKLPALETDTNVKKRPNINNISKNIKSDDACLFKTKILPVKYLTSGNKLKVESKHSMNVISYDADDFRQNANRKIHNKQDSLTNVARFPKYITNSIKQPIKSLELIHNTVKRKDSANEIKAKIDGYCTTTDLKEDSSEGNNFLDYSQTWEKLRSTPFRMSPGVTDKSYGGTKRNIIIVPSGMGC